MEWSDLGVRHGARLFSRTADWTLRDMGWHATADATCEACSPSRVHAFVWLSATSPEGRDLRRAVSPTHVAAATRPFPLYLRGEFRHESDPAPISIADLEGMAVRYEIDVPERRETKTLLQRVHLTALAAAKDCMELFGVIVAANLQEVPLTQVDELGSSMGIELYTPAPHAVVPTGPAWNHPQLGDPGVTLLDVLKQGAP